MTKSTFRGRFMRAQRKSGKTQQQIALESGLTSGATLHEKLKSARIDRDLEWLQKTARALGVSAEWLAFGTVASASPQALPGQSPAARNANSPSRKRGDR